MPIRLLSFQCLAGNSDENVLDPASTPPSYRSIDGFSMIRLEDLDKKV
jgi:hypothetical protein